MIWLNCIVEYNVDHFGSTALYCFAATVFCKFGKTEPIKIGGHSEQHSEPSLRYNVSEDVVLRLLESGSESDLD